MKNSVRLGGHIIHDVGVKSLAKGKGRSTNGPFTWTDGQN